MRIVVVIKLFWTLGLQASAADHLPSLWKASVRRATSEKDYFCEDKKKKTTKKANPKKSNKTLKEADFQR